MNWFWQNIIPICIVALSWAAVGIVILSAVFASSRNDYPHLNRKWNEDGSCSWTDEQERK